LALNRSYKDQAGEWKDVTDFVDIVAWGPLGERVSQYLSKGRRCFVQGRLQSRSWEQDGQKRSKLEVLANDVTFLDSRSNDGGASNDIVVDKPSKGSAKKEDVVIEDIGDEPINLDDIPF
jgi:single-strand DNA-binding protein